MLSLLFLALAMQADLSELVRIDVAKDAPTDRAHSISIQAQESRRPRSAEELDARGWVATRTWDGGSQSVTSTECPAVRTVAMSFGDLPPVSVDPDLLTVMEGESMPIPPTIKDGYVTSLSFRTLTADGSNASITIRNGNVYRLWGIDAVRRLSSCWGPLAT